MSHNNYFATIKRRIHPYINNHVSQLVFYPQTENHRIFFSRPTSINSYLTKNYHLTGVNSSILYQNTQVNSDNSGASEKSSRITPPPPPLLSTLTLNKSSYEICILHQISRKNLNFVFPSL